MICFLIRRIYEIVTFESNLKAMKTIFVMLALAATTQMQGKVLPNPVVWADLSEKLVTEIRAIVLGPANAPLLNSDSLAPKAKQDRLDPLRYLQPCDKKATPKAVGKLRVEGFWVVTE